MGRSADGVPAGHRAGRVPDAGLAEFLGEGHMVRTTFLFLARRHLQDKEFQIKSDERTRFLLPVSISAVSDFGVFVFQSNQILRTLDDFLKPSYFSRLCLGVSLSNISM